MQPMLFKKWVLVSQASKMSFLTPASRVLVTQALVLSHLDYCSAVWSGAAKKHRSKLHIIQNKAARLALHCLMGV